MPEALPLTSKISQSSSSTTEYKTLKLSFGNGYEQRTPDGINNSIIKYTIVYSNLEAIDRNTVWTFLNKVKSTDWFTYTPPGGTSLKWVVDGVIQENPTSGNLYTISFSIRQVYDLV